MKYPTLVILGLILALVLTGEAKSKSKKQKNKLKEQFQKEAILPLAEPCKPANCKLPDCRCSDTILPRSKFQGKESEIPQVRKPSFLNVLKYLHQKHILLKINAILEIFWNLGKRFNIFYLIKIINHS